MAVERVLFQVNVRTAMSVGQASGLALALAARAGIPVAQYSPNEVKLAVAGYGGAEKAAVQAMVVRLLNLAEPPRAAGRRRRARPRAVPPVGRAAARGAPGRRRADGRLRRARSRPRWPRRGARGDRVGAGHGGRAQRDRRGARRGRRRRLPRAWSRSARARARRPASRRSSSRTCTCARTR